MFWLFICAAAAVAISTANAGCATHTAYIATLSEGDFSGSSEHSEDHNYWQSVLNFPGRTDDAYSGSWSAGNNQANEYIQADLGTVRKIEKIAIQGRADYDQWVTSFHFAYSLDGSTFQYILDDDGSQFLFSANNDRDTIVEHTLETPILTRYVRTYVQLWHEHISMRWEVYGCDTVNIALGKNTAQSTLSSNGYSHKAVDGCSDPNYATSDCGCSHTADEDNPWWAVDLGLMSNVIAVHLTNRGDCCSSHLSNIDIWVMSDNMDPDVSTNKVLCTHHSGEVQSGALGPVTFACDEPIMGSMVAIQIQGYNHVMLCEVEIFAEEPSHYSRIFNYAAERTVHITNDVTRTHHSEAVSASMVDNNHATCPDRMIAGDTNGKFTIELPHDVAVSKVRVYQSASCDYHCSTRLDLRAFGLDDPGSFIDYIKVNESDTNDGYDTSGRGFNLVILDECACTIKDRIQFDHFSGDQQVGCMDTGFSPYIISLDDGDIVLGVSEDEVHDGLANCYQQGLDLLNVRRDDYGYRSAIAFIAKKGYPEFTQRVMTLSGNGPATIDNVYVGAAPLHSFTAGTVTSALASSLSETCGTYDGLVGSGDVAVLECDPSDLPVGSFFQLDFPSIGVHFCEIEIYLGNMAEYCETDGDTCYYIPSRRHGTAADAQWECRTQYASSRLAEVDATEWQLANNQISSNADLANVNVMSGIVSNSGSWEYYVSGTAPPSSITSGQSTSNDVIYMQSDGTTSSMANNAMSLNPLCEVDKTLYEGSKHVLMRVPAGSSSSLGGSMYSMWTGTSFTPDLDTTAAANLVSEDVSVDSIFKSPIVDCAWDYVKEMRISMFKKGVEAGFLNFKVPDGATKTDFFTYANLMGTSWVDMTTYTECSMNGHTESGTARRWLFEHYSDGCVADAIEKAWFVVLDTDHTSCSSWDSASSLPAFLYSDSQQNTYEPGTDMDSADLFIASALLDSDAFGGSCVSSCAGVSDGMYHSCIGCNVYVTCTSGALEYGVCRAGQKWQATSDGAGSCEDSSTSCADPDAGIECNPDGCNSSPCQNGGTCSMVTAGGWECACADGWTGPDCSINIDECASSPCQNSGVCDDDVNGYTCDCADGYVDTHCETNFDECVSDPCQNGATCNDAVNAYTCDCDDGYEGTHCETNTDECASNPCQNAGACTDEVNGYTCNCADGYVDTHCETNFDECGSDPCQHGGTCNDDVNSYTCDCEDGFEGTHCETNIDECASSPCVNGDCQDDVNQYSCLCDDGFGGTHCDTDFDECESDPCQNSGNCTDQFNGYTCACVENFYGDDCEIGPCENNTDSCLNDGECSNAVDDTASDPYGYAECDCSGTGYTGDDCSEEDSTGGSSGRQTNNNDSNGGSADFVQKNPHVVAVPAAAACAGGALAVGLIARKMRNKKKDEQPNEAENRETDEPVNDGDMKVEEA